MHITKPVILQYLEEVAELLKHETSVEIVLLGGAAGMLTGLFEPARTTTDCDVINYIPADSQQAVLEAARKIAQKYDLPLNWLNSKAMELDILPDGWQSRKVHIATFGQLSIWSLSRKDLLATKFYAGHPRDREDIQAMRPTRDELDFVKIYLNMLRVPSRNANLDQIQRGLLYINAMGVD